MSKFTQENSLLWYDDSVRYIEITTQLYNWAGDVSMTMEFNAQGKDGEELYPDVFISKRFLENSEELANAIKSAINYSNSITDLTLTPIDDEAINSYAIKMANLYSVN